MKRIDIRLQIEINIPASHVVTGDGPDAARYGMLRRLRIAITNGLYSGVSLCLQVEGGDELLLLRLKTIQWGIFFEIHSFSGNLHLPKRPPDSSGWEASLTHFCRLALAVRGT